MQGDPTLEQSAVTPPDIWELWALLGLPWLGECDVHGWFLHRAAGDSPAVGCGAVGTGRNVSLGTALPSI